MSSDLIIKGFFSAVFSLILAYAVFSNHEKENGPERPPEDKQRYSPLIPGMLLPACLLALLVLGVVFEGTALTVQMTLSMCFGIFLHISLYYAVLMLALPFFRRHISARACAMLWMIPNYLYITMQSYMAVPEPLAVLRLSGGWVRVLSGIWLTGFTAVLLWKTVSHLRFRKQILAGAYAVTDPAVLELWRQEVRAAGMKKPKFRLVVSAKVSSPLTIGLFRRSLRVVLPERPYSPEELRLIFRHELIHIGREDSSSKFFLMFCTAMCWFNPLMWIAMRKSADDLELSCDETVLLDADGDTRRQYAGLLLDAAGDERGFTTCLSAGAAAMRYRMRAIVKPPRRHSGALVIGLVFFALCMTGGYVTLSYGGSTGEDVLFRHQDHSLFQLRSISQQNDAFHTTYICTDEDAFKAYLAGLETDILAGNYSFSGNGRQFTFLFDTPQGTLGVLLSDNVLKLVPLYGETPSPSSYYLPRGAGWDCLDAIILASPAMNVHLNRAGEPYGRGISATLDRLSVTEHNGEQLLYSSGLSEEEISGFWGYGPCEATLSFSCPPEGSFTVEITNRKHTVSDTVTFAASEGPWVIRLPDGPAHYRVCGTFRGGNGERFNAEFRFVVGDTGNS